MRLVESVECRVQRSTFIVQRSSTSVIPKPNRHCLGNSFYSRFSISKSDVKQDGTVKITASSRSSIGKRANDV